MLKDAWAGNVEAARKRDDVAGCVAGDGIGRFNKSAF